MGSRMHSRLSATGSRRSSRSGTDEFMPVEIGTVAEEVPWSFSVKLEDGSTIQCQLQGVQELPVAKYFLQLADDLDGHFEMAIVGHIRKIRLVLLQMQHGDMKRDVAAVMKECYAKKSYYKVPKKNQPPPSITLPHHEKFFKSIQESQMRRKQHGGSEFSYEESEYAFNPNEADGMSCASQYAERYIKMQSKGYDTSSKPVPYCRNKVVGLPEMRSDTMLRGYDRASSSVIRTKPSRAPSTMETCDMNKNLFKCKDQNWLWGKSEAPPCSPPSVRSSRMPSRVTFSRLDVSQFFGKPFRGSISHVNHPDCFYVVPDKLVQDKFLGMIQSKYLAKPKETLPAAWQNTAFAIEVAGKWQRGLVKSVENDGRMEIFLVDSGWKGFSHWPVKMLDPEDASVPPKAICCMMRGLHRIDWTKDEIAQLKGLREKVDVILFSQVGKKYSAVILEENETVFNAVFGSCGLVDLLRKTNIDVLAMQEGMTYEVRLLGTWGKQVYIKLKERCADLHNLESQLMELEKEGPMSLKKGQFALAIDDKCARRAKILKASSSSTHATCLFVDHGTTKEVPVSMIYHLPEHFMVAPAFATLCIVAPRESEWPNKYLQIAVLGEMDGLPVVALANDRGECFDNHEPSETDSQMSQTLHRSSGNCSPVPFRSLQAPSQMEVRHSQVPSQMEVRHSQVPSQMGVRHSQVPSQEGLHSSQIGSQCGIRTFQTPSQIRVRPSQGSSQMGFHSSQVPSQFEVRSSKGFSRIDSLDYEQLGSQSSEVMQSRNVIRAPQSGLNSLAPSVAMRPSVAATLARGLVGEPAHSKNESTIMPEGTELGTVTHVQSSSLVYVRLASKDAEFSQLQAQIDQEALNAPSKSLEGEKMCLAFSKGRWMRAEVLPGGSPRALYIDIGHRGPLGEVRAISSELMNKPAATLLCLTPSHLEGLKEGCKVQVQITADGNKVVGLAASQEGMQVDAASPLRKSVIVLDIEFPQRVWLVEEKVSYELMTDTLRQLDRSALTDMTNPVIGEICAVRVTNEWYRAKVVNTRPLTFFLVDVAYNVNISAVQRVVHLNRLLKMAPPLAKSYDLVNEDISDKCVAKIKKLLANVKDISAMIQEDSLLGLWFDGVNVLEAAGYLVKVHVTFIDEDGSVWVTRKTKAERRTHNLQSAVVSLLPMTNITIGTRCVARNLTDNVWYRAEVVGLSHHFKIVRFLDTGIIGESVELREWWDKPETDARRFPRVNMPVTIDQELLSPKSLWLTDQPPIYNLDMVRIN